MLTSGLVLAALCVRGQHAYINARNGNCRWHNEIQIILIYVFLHMHTYGTYKHTYRTLIHYTIYMFHPITPPLITARSNKVAFLTPDG
jgi:hypothetical protein